MDLFSIYFPQFYPIAINDKIWGKGFTDWDLVSIANMRKGWDRRAPRRGFYQGNSEETFKEQIREMKDNGLKGIALYHYHFDKSYELNEMEKYLSRQSDIDWFVIWATENWSKRWIGDSETILELSTDPSQEYINEHVDYLNNLMKTKKYKKINGRPLFGFYKLDHFINPKKVVNDYRKSFARYNLDVYIFSIITNEGEIQQAHIVDGNYIFEPRFFFNKQRSFRDSKSRSFYVLSKKIFGEHFLNKLLLLMDRIQQNGQTYNFNDYLHHLVLSKKKILQRISEKKLNWILSSGWNNYPRYNKNYTKLNNPSSEEFEETLNFVSELKSELPPIINAWNEWSEGSAIEPCFYLKDRYLKSIKLFKK
jgi:hypothetical protein